MLISCGEAEGAVLGDDADESACPRAGTRLAGVGALLGGLLLGCSSASELPFPVVDGPSSGGTRAMNVAGRPGQGGTAGVAGVGGSAAGAAGAPGPASGGTGGRSGGGISLGGSGAQPDAGPGLPDAQPSCDPCPCSEGPFLAPEPITGLGLSGDTLGPRISADGLTLFFSEIDGDEDIFTATRTGRGTEFSSATPLPNLDVDGSIEGTPFPSFDGLSLYFFATRAVPDAVGDRDIWVATRPNAAAAFADPFVLPVVNAVAIDHLPWLSQDELTLMLVSGRPSPNGVSNIWVAERAGRDEDFGEPIEVEGVNTDAREEGFVLSNDGLTLIFASNRVTESMDLWQATRPDLASPFGPAENLAELNSPENDLDVSLSADGFELFFTSSRNGAFQLFRSVRDCSAAVISP